MLFCGGIGRPRFVYFKLPVLKSNVVKCWCIRRMGNPKHRSVRPGPEFFLQNPAGARTLLPLFTHKQTHQTMNDHKQKKTFISKLFGATHLSWRGRRRGCCGSAGWRGSVEPPSCGEPRPAPAPRARSAAAPGSSARPKTQRPAPSTCGTRTYFLQCCFEI